MVKMQYVSTRNAGVNYSASQAIAQGLAQDGGLLTPFYIPRLPGKALEELGAMAYPHRAVYVMKQFLEEFSVKELTDYANAAYGPQKFDTPAVAPVRTLDGTTHCLELWHGPTCAFKDMALQMLPHLLTAALEKTEESKTACILVATSGDTGKGALEGFKDVPRTLEDFYGDMDFKVGGTRNGITAIQVDIKVDGLSMDVIAEAFEKTRKARLYILDEIMAPAIAEPRPEVSPYAPKVIQTYVRPDKIREVIGSGGKVIQKICADCDVTIDIEDDGSCVIMGVDMSNVKRALSIVESIANDPEVGAIYKGQVTRLMAFGAFVEIAPGKEGLVHISKLADHRVAKVEDVVNVGDTIFVKVTEIDAQGRINLSRKDAMADLAAKRAQQGE